MKLLSSVIHIHCNKCNVDYPDNEKCPKCGGFGGGIVFKSGNCTICTAFTTDGMSYPTGKCRKHNIITDIKEYCTDFDHDSKLSNNNFKPNV